MEGKIGGATNVDQKVDGPCPITLEKTTQTSHLKKNRRRKVPNHMEKSTWEKDQLESWFDESQCHFNHLKRINALNEQPAEPPDNKTAMQPPGCVHKNKSKWSHFRITMALGLTKLGATIDPGGSKIVACCRQVFFHRWQQARQADCCNMFHFACEMTRLITVGADVDHVC